MMRAWLAGAGLVILALVTSWFGGRKSAQTSVKLEKAKEYVDTSKRINVVDIGDIAAAREFLRTRNK